MPALIEKTKMSNAMYDALKAHIMRERQRKKQEQEQDEAIERMRRERENKQKRDVMTLEETKEQIVQLEEKLKQQRDDKHQLFLQLKKVLNEDETRRKARETSDLMSLGHFSIGAPNMFLQTGPISGRNLLYKGGPQVPQQTLIQTSPMKRPRSPSPPPMPYNYKIQTNYPHKQGQYSNPSNQQQQQSQPHYYAPSQSQPTSYQGVGPVGSQQTYNYPVHGPFPLSAAQSPVHQSNVAEQSQPQPPKHLPHGYHIQHVQQSQQPVGYASGMHSAMEHQPKTVFTDEKYYSVPQHAGVPLRGIAVLHPQTLIPIQQQPKPGGITSGYPIRSQPPAPSTSAYAPPSSTPQHNVYSSPQTGPPRHGYSNQPPPPGRYY